MAAERGVPLVSVAASGGARMQENVLALMQMAKTVCAVDLLRESGVPYVSVLAHPTTGGVIASFAALGDFVIAEPDALLSFAGPRVVQETTRETLPHDFGRSESSFEHGLIDAVVKRPDLKDDLGRILRLCAGGTLVPIDVDAERAAARHRRARAALPALAPARRGAHERRAGMNSRLPTPFRGLRRRLAVRAAESDIWDAVQLARDDGRPYTLDYANRLVDEWVELHGDRAGTDDHAIVAGIGSFRGRTIAIIGHQKGRDLKERAFRNFGMAQPRGLRQGAPRLRARRPPRLPGRDDDRHAGRVSRRRGGAGAARRRRSPSRCWRWCACACPTVACVIGEGGSGGALAIGVADRVLMLEHSIYSVISPEGCATILWRDVNQRKKAAAAFKPTARFSYELGVVDTVVPEPSGGAHKDHDRAARLLGDAIAQALESIEAEPIELRRAARRAKFRRMGVWLEDGVVVGEKEPEPGAPVAPAGD